MVVEFKAFCQGCGKRKVGGGEGGRTEKVYVSM